MGKWHALHTAAISGDIAAVQKEFYRHGSNSAKGKGGKQRGNVLNDLQDSNGYTALHFAIQCGNVELIKWMIEKGADVNIQSKQIADGVTPLLIASRLCCDMTASKDKARDLEPAAKLLLESGANPRIGRAQDGFTPLHLSAKANNCRLGRLILEHVPSTISVLSRAGLSCIDVAKTAGASQFVLTVSALFPELNLQTNHNLSRSSSSSRRKGRGGGGGSPKAGAGGINNFDSRLCRTLIELTRNGNPERLKDFLRLNPSVDLNWTMGKNGWTALMEVSATGNVLIAQVLLEGGADSEVRSKKGATALHIAARYGHREMLALLLDKGACLDAVTPAGETVEEVASIFGQSAAFAFFVTYRADLIVSRHRQADRQAEQRALEDESVRQERKGGEGEGTTATVSPGGSEAISPSGSIEGLVVGNDFSLPSWLTDVGLGKYVDVLHSNGFDSFSSLSMITAEDFKEMRFLLGHKRLFLAELSDLKSRHPHLFAPKPKSFSFAPATPSRSVSSEDLARREGEGGNSNSTFKSGNSSYSGSGNSNNASSSATLPLLRSAASTPDLIQPEHSPPPSSSLWGGGGVYAVADVLKQEQGGREGGSPSRSSSMSDISSASTTDLMGAPGGSTRVQERYNDTINSSSPHPSVHNQMTMIKEIRYEEISIGRVIGEGSFGVVRFGVWRGMSVAVKALKITEGFSTFASQASSGTEQQLAGGGGGQATSLASSVMSSTDDEFLRHEAQLMARVCNHDHVIQFVGIVVLPCPCVVTIFCARGSVEDLLVRANTTAYSSCLDRGVSPMEVLRMALEAARGILHLHLEGVIHRDLAARNLLLDANLHVRVGDFGFSRVKAAAASKGYTKSDMGPIRWLAPEAMRRKTYSEASDVFSFGVVLYEMFWGLVPWAEYDTLDVAIRVCSGERMQVQGEEGGEEGLLAQLLRVMQACWSHAATTRPSLSDVISSLEGLQRKEAEHGLKGGRVVVGVEVDVDWEHHEVGGRILSTGPTDSCHTDHFSSNNLSKHNNITNNMYSMKLGNDVVVDQQL